jgi:RHS repeat-associated protein
VHSDHLDTPRLITDDSNQPVWQWPYSAFGDNLPTGVLKAKRVEVEKNDSNETEREGSRVTSTASVTTTSVVTTTTVQLKATDPAITLNLRFAGQYRDSETGLFYNGMRTYAPQLGAYTQMDPIGLGGGLNRRGYVGGNAFSNTDPTGLFVPANHNGITTEAIQIAGSPCPDLPGFVALADFLPGSQAPSNSFWHAMRDGTVGESAQSASAKYQQYVDEQIRGCSCAGLARALHAIQDSYSPAHSNFQPWNGSPVPLPSHVFRDSYPSNATRQQAVNASVSAIRRYKEQCTGCQK